MPTAKTSSSAPISRPSGPLVLRLASRSSEAVCENSTSVSSMMICMTLPTKESITLAVTAAAGGIPRRWKKRMSTAIRATDEGSARFMNPVASCIM